MTAQKILKLEVPRRRFQSAFDHQSEQQQIRLLSRGKIRYAETDPRKLFSDLLKRQALEAMNCVTECEPVNVPANLARLRDIEESMRFAINHGWLPDGEAVRSDKQLQYASTIGDLLECLKLTKQHHRAPACVSNRDSDFQRIERKLDLIAGAIAITPELQEMLFNGAEAGQ